MTAEMAIPSSETNKPQKVLLGGITALAQSAWMGFALASDVLEQLRLAPTGILRRIQVIRPAIPRDINLKNLLTREYSVGEASFILMASFFLSAALGAVRQVLFNAQFGVSQQANAYYAAFRLPDTLFSLIAGGALSSAMIPILLSATAKEGQRAAWRLVDLVLTLLLVVFVILVILGELFAPFFVSKLLAPGFDTDTSRLTITLTRIMLIQPVVLAFGSVATAVLNSQNRFALTALSIISHNVALITGILIAGLVPSIGIYGPTLGVIVGAILQTAILAPGLRSHGFAYRPALDMEDVNLREVIKL